MIKSEIGGIIRQWGWHLMGSGNPVNAEIFQQLVGIQPQLGDPATDSAHIHAVNFAVTGQLEQEIELSWRQRDSVFGHVMGLILTQYSILL